MFRAMAPTTDPGNGFDEGSPTLLREITLRNFLSFGPDTAPVLLRPINILIGPNGAGKSNLIEAIALLRATRRDLDGLIRNGGGVHEWLWKPEKRSGADINATIEAVVARAQSNRPPLRYRLQFGAAGPRFRVLDERIEDAHVTRAGASKPYFYFGYENGTPLLNVSGTRRRLQPDRVDPSQSILAQRRDPEQYPELTELGDRFEQIPLYRDWISGRSSRLRDPQRADMPNDRLLEDGTNLGLVLNAIHADHYEVWGEIKEALRDLLNGFDELVVKVEAGSVQTFFMEGSGRRVPAVRLSDGTLRFLCLLAVLCNPKPAPLTVIEEPELGLHPDAIAVVARLLRAASARTQLVVTTHSDRLIDVFSETPEDIVVVERSAEGTQLRRLDREALTEWLKEYRLSQLWSMGVIGGNRW